MGKKILIVITNHSTYPTKKEKTGLWFAELVHFYDLLAGAGYEMDFVSPKGGAVPIDPRSLSKVFLDRSSKTRHHDPGFMRRLDHTLSPDQVIWEDYIAVYYTGGHGTMWDFPENERFQEISRNIYEHGGVVSAVCHGNGALVNVRRSDGTYLITGKKATGFSNLEEKMALIEEGGPLSSGRYDEGTGREVRKGDVPLYLLRCCRRPPRNRSEPAVSKGRCAARF